MPEFPEPIRAFWAEFVARRGVDPSERFTEVFYFADTPQTADRLADLVIAGDKRATAGLLWSYESDRDPLPKEGGLSVVTMWDGTPRCVIETVKVEVVPFAEVSADFARAEGEGDKSLRYWREAHWAFFSRECARIGRRPSHSMPLVCEHFEVVFVGARPTP